MPRATDGDLRKDSSRKSRRPRSAKKPIQVELSWDNAGQELEAPIPRTQQKLSNVRSAKSDVARLPERPETQNTTYLVLHGKTFRCGPCSFESYYEERTCGAIAPSNLGGNDPLPSHGGFKSLVSPLEFGKHAWFNTLLSLFDGTLHAVAHPIQSLRLVATQLTVWWHITRFK
jgi:hypothetical protein